MCYSSDAVGERLSIVVSLLLLDQVFEPACDRGNRQDSCIYLEGTAQKVLEVLYWEWRSEQPRYQENNEALTTSEDKKDMNKTNSVNDNNDEEHMIYTGGGGGRSQRSKQPFRTETLCRCSIIPLVPVPCQTNRAVHLSCFPLWAKQTHVVEIYPSEELPQVRHVPGVAVVVVAAAHPRRQRIPSPRSPPPPLPTITYRRGLFLPPCCPRAPRALLLELLLQRRKRLSDGDGDGFGGGEHLLLVFHPDHLFLCLLFASVDLVVPSPDLGPLRLGQDLQ